ESARPKRYPDPDRKRRVEHTDIVFEGDVLFFEVDHVSDLGAGEDVRSHHPPRNRRQAQIQRYRYEVHVELVAGKDAVAVEQRAGVYEVDTRTNHERARAPRQRDTKVEAHDEFKASLTVIELDVDMAELRARGKPQVKTGVPTRCHIVGGKVLSGRRACGNRRDQAKREEPA